MMEQSFDPQSRLRYQALYSTLMEDRKRIALLLKLRMEVITSASFCIISPKSLRNSQLLFLNSYNFFELEATNLNKKLLQNITEH